MKGQKSVSVGGIEPEHPPAWSLLFEQNIGDVLYLRVAIVTQAVFREGGGAVGAVGVATRQEDGPAVSRAGTGPATFKVCFCTVIWIH